MSSSGSSQNSENKNNKICRICHVVEHSSSKLKRQIQQSRPYSPPKWSFTHLFAVKDKKYSAVKEADGDELIAPCECRGTMRFVHRDCLNQWRTASPRSDSFTRCEQCFAPYEFKSTWITSLIIHPFTLYTICALLFTAWIVASTFVSTGAFYNNHSSTTTATIPSKLFTLLPVIYFNNSPAKNPLSKIIPLAAVEGFIFGYNDFMERFNGLFYGLVFVALTEYIFFTPSFLLSFNTLFCIWRIQRYEIFLDKWLLVGFTVFGLLRAWKSLYAMIEAALTRIIKLKLLEVVNKEDSFQEFARKPSIMKN